MIDVDGDGSPAIAAIVESSAVSNLLVEVIPLVDIELVSGPADIGTIDGSDIPIDKAVVVVVSHRLPHTIFFLGSVGAVGHLREGAIGVVAEVMAGSEIRDQ